MPQAILMLLLRLMGGFGGQALGRTAAVKGLSALAEKTSPQIANPLGSKAAQATGGLVGSTLGWLGADEAINQITGEKDERSFTARLIPALVGGAAGEAAIRLTPATRPVLGQIAQNLAFTAGHGLIEKGMENLAPINPPHSNETELDRLKAMLSGPQMTHKFDESVRLKQFLSRQALMNQLSQEETVDEQPVAMNDIQRELFGRSLFV